MDVRMPDGTIITGVPENITQTDLLARYDRFSAAAPSAAQPESEGILSGLMKNASKVQASKDAVFGQAKSAMAPKPATPFEQPAVDAMGNPTGMEEQPFEQPQGLAAIAPKQPSELAVGEEFGKGLGAGVVGLKSMWENAGVMKDVGALGTVQQRLDLFGKIDAGAITDFEQLHGLDLTTSQARAYLGATPEMREKMKERLTGEVGQRTDFVKASIDTLAKYQQEMQQFKGRTVDLTDVEGAKDFANWLSYNVGSGAVQMAPIMIAAATTGPGGVALLGTGMGVSEAVGNRMDALAPKLKGLNPDQQAEAVIDYVTKTGDTSLAVGVISGAFDTVLGPAATLAKRGLSQVVKGETRKEALKAGVKEIPKQMGEEFITGGAQEATQIAGAVREGEVDEFLTKENAKKIFNAAAAEAAGSVGGGGATTAARVYGANKAEGAKEDLLKQAFEVPAGEDRATYTKPEATDLESLARSKGFLTPEAPKTTADLVKETAPTSDSQDYEAMLAELEAQLEGKPAPAKAAEPVAETVAEPVAEEPVAEPVAEAPAVKESLTPEPVAEPAAEVAQETQAYDAPDLRLKQADALGDTLEQLVYGEMESYGRAALKKKSLTAGYADRKDNWTKAMEAGDQAFATNDYSAFEPYAALFPKTAKKLQAHLSAETKAEPTPAATNLQVAEKDIKGKHDVINTASDFNDAEFGWLDTATNKLHMQYADGTPVKHYAGDKTSTGVANLTPITNADEALAAVSAGKQFVTVGEDSAAVKEAAPVAAPAAAKAKPKAKETPLRQAAYAKNPFMTFLADKGLYHAKGKPNSMKSEFSPDKAVMVSGHGPVFKASGMQVDAMLPIAIEYGYLPQDATESDLSNLIRTAMSGKKVEPLYSAQGVEDTAAKYEARMAEEEIAYEERAAQTDAEWHGMSEQEYMDLMAREVAAVSDEDFAELDEAINELTDTPAGNMSVRAAMEALGFTEQEIQDEENRNAPKADEAVAGEPTQGDEAGQAAPALELETQTAEELKAKQDEIDRLTKENERLSKQAEAKAKADAERDEFVLTGSDRPADVAAAQGQQDIFGAAEEAPAAPEDRFKKYVRKPVATTPKIERETNPSGKTTDGIEWKVTGPSGEINRFEKKKDAQELFDSYAAEEVKSEVADEVVGPAEKPAAPQLTREPVTIEGEFTEVGEEKQRALITTQVEKLSDAQTATLEKFYGFARDTEEFANAVRQDVVNFITKGATYVNGKIRAIIRSMANGVLSVAVAFNPQFVSMPYTIAVPQFETRIEQVMQQVPASVQNQMSEDAQRAYATIYPAIKADLQAKDKFFIVADKQTANTFVFNPDGTPFMASKTLMGAGIGDFVKGNNNIVSNRITPAGLFDLGLRDAKRSVDEAATAGEYDFGKVFVLDKSQKGANGFYSTTIMHSVWTKEADAKQRLAALQKPGAEDSRYSFGCINVDKATYGQLVEKNLAQMDGAKIFIVPENGADVMSFVNGEATYSTDIIRQRAEPVTKEVKQEVQRAAPKAETERTVTAKEEEGPVFNSIERPMITISFVEEEKKRSPSFKRKVTKLNKDHQDGKISIEQLANEADWAVKQSENERLSKETPEKKRGYLELVNRLSKAAQKGEISTEAFELATWFMRNNELLVEDLGVEILGKGKEGVGGQYLKGSRVIRLIKDAGSNLTVVHEILHHLERMMPVKVQQAIRKAWSKQLLSAQKKAKTPAEQLYFKLLVDGHYGNDNFSFVDVPDGEMSKVFMKALAELDFRNPDSRSSFDLAEILLQSGMVKIDNYQYFNPSEFWAVNGSDIVKGRFDAIQGGVLARLKNWLKELAEKIKSLVGMNSDASIIRALDSLSKADGTFVTKDMLGEGEYKSVRRNYEGNEAPAASWESPEESKMDNFIYKLQDKFIDTKRVIQAIKKTSGEIADNWDAYLKEELFHGRAAKRTQDFMNREMLPILEEMKENGVTLDEFEKYLHMRHAEERNAFVAKRNPKLQDQGSGATNAAAAKYLANLTPEQEKTYGSLAEKFDKIIGNTQKLLVDSGLEKQETIDAWNQAYEHYVPLMRDDLDFKHHGKGLGSGYSTGGNSSKFAFGSTKKVIDIFANVALQRERAIVRAEKARVGRALYGLAIKNPNPGFWLPINPEAIKDKDKLIEELEAIGLSSEDAENLIQEPKVPGIDKKTGLVKYQVNPLMRKSDNVFPVRINGEDRYIFFNTSDERAIRMVEAFKNLDAEQLGLFLGTMGTVTRWIASVNTQYNPVFGLWNFARDVQGAAFNLTTTDIAGHEKEVLDGVLPALKGIYTDLRANRKKKAGDSEWAKLFEQYELAGGQTGYRDQFSQSEKRANIVAREMARLNRGNVRKVAGAVFDWLSDYNDAMENAVRLSAFKVALDQGLSEERAASIAKNLTVNFNRKGAASPTLQTLFAFFNAAVQGTTRLVETLRGPAGKKIMAGGMAIGVAQAIALAMAGFDDDDPPEFLKNKNLIIPTPGGTYLIIPMPLGFNVFPGIGRLTTEYVLGQAGLITGAKSGGDKLISVASLLLDSFNPLGSGSVLQMVTPTVADPGFAIAANRDSFGRPISKEDRATAPTPGYTRSRENASWFSKQLAEFLNYVSSPSGTKYTKGLISPTADQLDYLIGQYTGGVGREVVKAAQYATAVVEGETGDLPSYRVPIVGKLYGETESPAAISAKFYENVIKLAEHENEIKMRIKNKDDVKEYRAEHPETRFMNRVNNIENQITALNKQKKALQERDAPEERIKKLDERKTEMMRRFNDQIKNLERQQ